MFILKISCLLLLYFSTMKHQHKSPSKFFGNNKNKVRYVDASKQDDFIFNRTPILASALQKLKKNAGKTTSQPKRQPQQKLIQQTKIKKKIKTNQPASTGPLLSYTPLQQDLYNFFSINKTAIKSIEMIPEPKFEIGSTILTAIADRGIGGKYLVTNLFRNKKGYIDYKDVSISNNPQAIQSYEAPGNFVVATVVKGTNPKSIQLSLNKFLDIDQKILRVGQCLPAQIKSKQQVGCHLQIFGLKNYKAYLSKQDVDQQAFENLQEKKQILCVIKQINHGAHLIKLGLAQEQLFFNLKGIQEQQMSKMQLNQFVAPGTLVNTKILKIVKNGVIVKFLKIFLGYIHADHLQRQLNSYVVDDKIAARVIYYCVSPPTLYLSQKHVSLAAYNPIRPLYYPVQKPLNLVEHQNSYFNNQQQFFVHPSQLHSELANIGKFWVKQNNYFQRYQIMTSKKLGLRVGEVAKAIPFTNFKIYGEGEGKFRVMCIDVWNKVVKVSYDQKVIKSENMLIDIDQISEDVKYCGFINGVNKNGVIVQFCNNIRGIISAGELKMSQLNLNENNIGQGIEAYVSNIKKGLLGLSLLPPDMRNRKKKQDTIKSKKNQKNILQQQTTMGIIKSINTKTINPIYLLIKGQLVKISVFDGIKPASLDGIEFIKNLQQSYAIGQKIPVYRKGNQYYLYPPQQLVDKDLRICRVVGFSNHYARVQVSSSKFLNCHITEITDLIVPYPFSEIKIGQFYLGKILPNGTICLRQSIVQNGIPKSMKEYKEKFDNSQYRGDYRNRLLIVGSAGLNVEDVAFGYVKSFSGKGVFVSLNSQYDVRVQLSELSDQYIQDKQKQFRQNKLLLMRLISQKVRPSEPNKKLFDASCRQSVVKHGYPLNQQALMVGLTVSGVVTGFAKGKALVRIDASKYTGIIAQRDIEGINLDLPFQKQVKIGTHLTCKIIELKNDEGRQLIRLSTLKKFFEKNKGVQLKFEDDERIFNLWNSFKQMDQVQPPKTQKQIVISEQLQQQEDEYERLNRLLAEGEIENEEKGNQNAEEMDIQQNQQQNENQEEEEQQQEQEQQEQEQQENQQVQQAVHQSYPKQQLSKLMSQFQKMPHPPSFYQSLVLANPTSESYLMYISSLLPVSTPEQIRSQFTRAIAALSDIKDKDNLWISWLNTEIILGGFMTTVKKALQSDVGRDVYNRIVQILMQQQKWTVALEFSKKMLKKFNKDPKAYSLFIKSILKYSGQNNLPDRFSPNQVIKKAYQCLKANDAVTIEIQYGKSLYELNQNQKARNVFENLITKYPKRTDIWNVYIDLEVKHGQLDRGRNLLQRALSMDLKKKKTITILKKYHQIQQKYGTQETVQNILKRAQAMAQQGIDQQQSEQQIQD